MAIGYRHTKRTIEHSMHQSFINFIANVLSVIATYCFFPKIQSLSL